MSTTHVFWSNWLTRCIPLLLLFFGPVHLSEIFESVTCSYVCCVRIFICNWTIGHVRICGTKPSHRGGSPKSSLCHVSQLLLPPCLSLTLFILQLLILILNKKKSGSFAAVSSYDGSASFNCRRELTGSWTEDKPHIWRKPTVFACDGSETHKTCFA